MIPLFLFLTLAPPVSWFAPASPTLGRRVLAHYFAQFQISIDDEPPSADYYSRQYLLPEGENGKFRAVGGFLRERPEPSGLAGKGFRSLRRLNMDQEIRRAQEAGLDGFDLDILSLEDGAWQPVENLVDAADDVPGFSILLKPDMMAGLSEHPDDILDVVRRLKGHRCLARRSSGEIFVSPYLPESRPPNWWRRILATPKAEGTPLALLPTFLDPSHWRDFAGFSAGYRQWDGAALERGGLRIATVVPQYFRPNVRVVVPSVGSERFRRMWKAARDSGAPWVSVTTWNDYSEATEIAPSSGIGRAFSQLNAYYAAWFHARKPPKILKDTLFVFYRRALAPRPGEPGADWQGANSLEDKLEVVAFLTGPARLTQSEGGRADSRLLPAGVTGLALPLQVVRPTFGRACNEEGLASAPLRVRLVARALCPTS